LNLYGFVGGNPASKAAPDGHADPRDITIPKMPELPPNDKNRLPRCFCEKFPNDPSGLGPHWKPDATHKNPNGQRFRRPDGWGVDFDKAQKGKPGFRGEDHWHVVPPGETKADKDHHLPGDEMPIPNEMTVPIPNGLLPAPGGLNPVPNSSPCGGIYAMDDNGRILVAGGPCDSDPLYGPLPAPGTRVPLPERVPFGPRFFPEPEMLPI
jgi:hypothetical protein